MQIDSLIQLHSKHIDNYEHMFLLTMIYHAYVLLRIFFKSLFINLLALS